MTIENRNVSTTRKCELFQSSQQQRSGFFSKKKCILSNFTYPKMFFMLSTRSWTSLAKKSTADNNRMTVQGTVLGVQPFFTTIKGLHRRIQSPIKSQLIFIKQKFSHEPTQESSKLCTVENCSLLIQQKISCTQFSKRHSLSHRSV